MVKPLYLQSSGGTNNCQIEVLFKWLEESTCIPSTILVISPLSIVIEYVTIRIQDFFLKKKWVLDQTYEFSLIYTALKHPVLKPILLNQAMLSNRKYLTDHNHSYTQKFLCLAITVFR